ncbi:HyaD/HybD family hydrogenase maturation endopeptidase [Telmatospirillum sp. J64-1]|uniref:HyaD/HybD family hydrogenase maturation endopeptidase n=1 Tax=Telmatospirillum sp. J64-1 TaxID=2502183 RepID=UPI00115E1DFB|nr:HyaD/HybD family hydrogenase maturation endopeptidase [Telmatospirillum sp. J64-1]
MDNQLDITPERDEDFDILVLGIGNLLWADEGFGIRVVEEMHRRYRFPDPVRLMDGGTQGLYLVQYVKACRRLLVFDAIDYGEPPGTMKLVRDEEVPRFMGVKKMSLHQTGFQEVISAAELLGWEPEAMALIGVQAEELEDWGGSLRKGTKARIPQAIEEGLKVLAEWGVQAQEREEPPATGLLRFDLDIAGYEAGRTAILESL